LREPVTDWRFNRTITALMLVTMPVWVAGYCAWMALKESIEVCKAMARLTPDLIRYIVRGK
jgi:hypothetical protein